MSLSAPRDMDQVRRELLKLVGKAAVATISCAMVPRSAVTVDGLVYLKNLTSHKKKPVKRRA